MMMMMMMYVKDSVARDTRQIAVKLKFVIQEMRGVTEYALLKGWETHKHNVSRQKTDKPKEKWKAHLNFIYNLIIEELKFEGK